MTLDLVDVASFATVAEAETVRGLLEQAGIPSALADAHLLTAHPFLGVAVGQVRIRVERERVEQAVEVIRLHSEETQAARDEADYEGVEGEEACIACGASFPEYLEKCPACGLSYS